MRPTAFATNTLLYWAAQIRETDTVHWPIPEAQLSVIHEDDLAAVVAHVLLSGDYRGQKLVITGPATLTPVEQLEAIGRAVGRPLVFEEISTEAARTQMLSWGLPKPIADGVLGYWGRRVSDPEPVTNTVEALIGRPARTFQS